MRHQTLTASHRVHHVDLEVLGPILLAVKAASGADVRHEDIAPAKRLRGAPEPRLIRLAVADVHRLADGVDAPLFEGVDRGVHLNLCPRAQPDVHTFLRQQLNDGAADPSGGAGDYRLLSP